MSINHKAEARRFANLDVMSAARMGTEQASVRVQVAQVHATLALVEATDALAAKQHTANQIAWRAQGAGGSELTMHIVNAVNP